MRPPIIIGWFSFFILDRYFPFMVINVTSFPESYNYLLLLSIFSAFRPNIFCQGNKWKWKFRIILFPYQATWFICWQYALTYSFCCIEIQKSSTPDKVYFSTENLLWFFLFLDENICWGYSLEVPPKGTSNETHSMFLWRYTSADSGRSVVSFWQKNVHKYGLTDYRTMPAQ